MLLIVLIQLQPIHVHAYELESDYSGHAPGTLIHTHSHDHSDLVDAGHEQQEHKADCHPVHAFSPTSDLPFLLTRMNYPQPDSMRYLLRSLSSIPDLPPPIYS